MNGTVRFFCACGKEIWEGLTKQDKKVLTIEIAEQTCQCADCIMTEYKSDDLGARADDAQAIRESQPDGPEADSSDGYKILQSEEE